MTHHGVVRTMAALKSEMAAAKEIAA